VIWQRPSAIATTNSRACDIATVNDRTIRPE